MSVTIDRIRPLRAMVACLIALLPATPPALAQQGDAYVSPYLSVDTTGRWAIYVLTDPAVAPPGTTLALFRGPAEGGSDMMPTICVHPRYKAAKR